MTYWIEYWMAYLSSSINNTFNICLRSQAAGPAKAAAAHLWSILGPNFENIRVVQKVGSETKMGDVGCDRMVFAMNSDLLLIKFNSFFNKWSVDQGRKNINPSIPNEFPIFSLVIGGTGRKAFQIYLLALTGSESCGKA